MIETLLERKESGSAWQKNKVKDRPDNNGGESSSKEQAFKHNVTNNSKQLLECWFVCLFLDVLGKYSSGDGVIVSDAGDVK